MNYTNWSQVTTPQQIIEAPNTSTDGMFWLVVNFLVWVVVLLTFLGFGVEVALLGSTFIALVISIFLVYLHVIAWQWCLFFVGFLIFTILYVVWSSGRDQ